MIDLHMHSSLSCDGEVRAEELAARCASQGISLFSVCDHNCARANEAAAAAARRNGLAYLYGMEIDCTCEGVDLHVLGYGIDAQSPDFQAIEQQIRVQSLRASRERLRKTQALGFHVTEEALREKCKDSYWAESWTGELFAEILLANPAYADHPLLLPYRPGGAEADNPFVRFYWDFYAPGKPCHVKEIYPSLSQVTQIIHRHHGAAVLAHPGVNLKGRPELLGGILARGIDGVEAFSSYHSPEQALFYARLARKRGLFITCGSDFHGKIKPSIGLGLHGCPLSDEALLSQLPSFVRQRIV